MRANQKVLLATFTSALCSLLIVTPVLGTESEPPPTAEDHPVERADDEFADVDEPVIPTGQEELLATMLGMGAALPDGCKFTGGGVERTLVKATYACPGGEVVYELTHPSQAPRSAIRTERFAIILRSGSPPSDLSETLASLIRSREEGFEWKLPRIKPAQPWPSTFVLAAAVVSAIILAGVWRRRLVARRSSSTDSAQ